jgi:hypothetical protein
LSKARTNTIGRAAAVSEIRTPNAATASRCRWCRCWRRRRKDIDWFGQHIDMNVTRNQVRSAPAWDPLAMADEVSEDDFHRHFGWPGYGW